MGALLQNGFKVTDLSSISVNASFDAFGNNSPFQVLYVVLTAAIIFIPIAIGIALRFDYLIMSLACPVALLIEHVYTLPFNSKPVSCILLINIA